MRSLILIALFISCGGTQDVTRRSVAVPFVMGGSHITITGIQIEENARVKCIVRFPDGRDSIELEPSVPRDRRSAICRLPPEINAGSVVVDLEITTPSTSTVILSEAVFVNPSPLAEVQVKENWYTKELSFTWDPEYFKQFYTIGNLIILQASLYVSESNKPDFTFTYSGIFHVIGPNLGTVKVSVQESQMERISNIHYPVLGPVFGPVRTNVRNG